MGITLAITELLAHGPDPWIADVATLAVPPGSHGQPGIDADEWDEFCRRVALPALDELTGVAVASGAAGLWLHGHIAGHPTTELRLVCIRPHPPHLWATLREHAHVAGWSLQVQSTGAGLLMGSESAIPVRLLRPPLPDEAFDGPRGYQRGTLADWALAVEALALTAMADTTDEAAAALEGLRFLLTDIPDVPWIHALRRLPDAARQSWLAGPLAAFVPELRELAGATPVDGVAS